MGKPHFIEALHWREVPPGQWRWRHFSPREMACRGTGRLKISTELLDRLEALRAVVGRPLVINSAYRSPEHNATLEGAAPKSLHVQGRAVDLSMAGHDALAVYEAAADAGFRGFGFYPEARNNFMHLDVGAARHWGNPRPWGIDPRKPLRKSRTLAGGALSLAGFAGQQAQEAGYLLQSFSDYGQAFGIACLVLSLVGIALVFYARMDDFKKGRR